MEPTSPALAGRFFTTSPSWEALFSNIYNPPKYIIPTHFLRKLQEDVHLLPHNEQLNHKREVMWDLRHEGRRGRKQEPSE